MNPSPALSPRRLRALLVDPSLFTAPYDAALTRGLLAAGVEPVWAVRPTRPGDRNEIGDAHVDPFFYRRVDQMGKEAAKLRAMFKGVAHGVGLARLIVRAWRSRPGVVHFQWTVIPLLDAAAIVLLRLSCPVVITVHDTVPFNGERISWIQSLAFDLPVKVADRVVVHTRGGRRNLIERGIPGERIAVVPHGPLELPVAPRVRVVSPGEGRMTFVAFGEMKPYKGIDVLVEAVGLLPASMRRRARVVVAGRARMDLSAVRDRVVALGLRDVVELDPRRLSEQEMADLFARADVFVFPYRQIDASGVYFLVKSLGKWLIASEVGVFAEELEDGVQGWLVPPGRAEALAEALGRAIEEQPRPAASSTASAWSAIGQATRAVYEEARRRWATSMLWTER